MHPGIPLAATPQRDSTLLIMSDEHVIGFPGKAESADAANFSRINNALFGKRVVMTNSGTNWS